MPQHLSVLIGTRSRFDAACGHFAGSGKEFIDELAAKYDFTYTSFFVSDDPIIPAGSKVLLCGERAWRYLNCSAKDVGYRKAVGRYDVICTYPPQDAADAYNVEALFDGLDDVDEDDTADGDAKDAASTNRANYRFWLESHLAKLLAPPVCVQPFSFSAAALRTLGYPTGEYLYLDIETHPASDTIQCLSCAIDDGPVVGTTIYGYDGRLQSGAIDDMVWLTRAFQRYTVVIHNAFFDLPFLAVFHGIPWGTRIHDTMLMWHRLYAEVDKSLAHLIQHCTNRPYHKDSAGTFSPHNFHQQRQLLEYNARDVFTLREIHRWLLAHHTPAMGAVNDSIPDYLFAQLRGFNLDLPRKMAHAKRLEQEDAQLRRIFAMLVGRADINPNSGKQIAEWLHDGLGYKVTSTTSAGAPATDATTLYKHLITNPKNAALKVLLRIKDNAKRLSMLGFEPYAQAGKR